MKQTQTNSEINTLKQIPILKIKNKKEDNKMKNKKNIEVFKGLLTDIKLFDKSPELKRILNLDLDKHIKKLEESTNKEINLIKDKDLTTQVIDENLWQDINNNRFDEQLQNLQNTSIVRNFGHDPLIKNAIMTFARDKITNRQSEKTFNQYVCDPNDTFSNWLTNLFVSNIDNIFSNYLLLYNLIVNNKFTSFNISEHVEEVGLVNTKEDELNYIHYDTDQDLLCVFNKGQCVYFKFKKLNLSVHELMVPGFDIMYRRYKKAKINVKQPVQPKTYTQETADYRIKPKLDDLDNLLEQVATKLKVTKDVYLKTLLLNKNNVFMDDNNQPVYLNQITKNDNLSKKVLFSIDKVRHEPLTAYFIDGHWFENSDGLPWDLIFLQGDQDGLEQDLVAYKDNNFGMLMLTLYIKLNRFTSPIKVGTITKIGEYSTYKFDKESEGILKQETYIKEQINYQPGNCYYGWKTRSTEKNKDYEIKTEGLTDLEILTNNREKFNTLIDKFKNKTLTDKEIKWCCSFFYYATRNTFQKMNVRLRTVFELIRRNRGKYLQFLDIIKIRYGGSVSILCSMFTFYYHVEISNTGQLILDDFKLHRVLDIYWLDVGKKLSNIVKSHEYYNGNKIQFIDFKNLQYTETWIGPMGNDGKSVVETISQRVYHQHDKILFSNIRSKKLNCELTTFLANKVFEYYWELVLETADKKESLFKGISETIRFRDVFSTDSSAGGLRSQFYTKGFVYQKIKQLDKNFEPSRANKKNSFMAEEDKWYINTIFSIPKTLCDMVLKPKELGKTRYIYSVTSDHYIMSSILTYHLEPYLNQLGVKVIVDETEVLTHNKDNKKNRDLDDYKVYNCFDYSEFNDQHLKIHKKAIYNALYNVIQRKQDFNYKDELLFICQWLAVACEKMMMRVNADNSIVYEHDGRLFSGERATTLINSLMSIFYYILIIINMGEFLFSVGQANTYSEQYEVKISTVWNELKIRQINLDLEQLFNKNEDIKNTIVIKELFNKNICLGDDNRTDCDNLMEAIIFNELAVLSGFVLKLEKCMVGIDISEFLRKIEVKPRHEFKLTVSKGYVNRSIASLVNGNPEGTDMKSYIGWTHQIYEMLNTILVRSNYSDLLQLLLEESWRFITRLNQKFKDISTDSLPTWLMYIPVNENGFGFARFDNKIVKCKVKLPTIPNPSSYSDNKIRYDVPTKPLDVRIDEIIVKKVIKYGDPNPKAIMKRKYVEKMNYINNSNLTFSLYSKNFMIAYNEYLDKIKKLKPTDITIEDCKPTQLSEFEYHFIKTQTEQQAFDFFDEIMSGKAGLDLVVKNIEKIDAFVRDLSLIVTNESTEQILDKEFGYGAGIFYLLKEVFYNQATVYHYIEPSAYNQCFSMFLKNKRVNASNIIEHKKMFNRVLDFLLHSNVK